MLARPRSPILVTYNGIHAHLEKTERGPGGGAPRKSFPNNALQIAGKYLFSFVICSRLFRKLTATQKYNVCLKVINGTLNLECLCKSIKDSTKARST